MAVPFPTRIPGQGLVLPDFLDIEAGLYRALVRALLPAVRRETRGLDAAVRAGDWAGADRISKAIDLGPAAKAAEQRVAFFGLSAALFGAALWNDGDPQGTWLDQGQGPPPEVAGAARLAVQALNGSQNEVLRAGLHGALETLRREREGVSKAAIGSFGPGQLAGSLNAAVDAGVRLQAGVSANVTTTRLAALGALGQAQFNGIGRWQWTAKLDLKTCPVCRRLHGRTFGVDEHVAKLKSILTASDPATAKALAPWPNQSKAGLQRLYRMTDQDLVQNGHSLPPVHPACRCVPVPVGTVQSSELVTSLAQALRLGQVAGEAAPEGQALLVPAGTGQAAIEEAGVVESAATSAPAEAAAGDFLPGSGRFDPENYTSAFESAEVEEFFTDPANAYDGANTILNSTEETVLDYRERAAVELYRGHSYAKMNKLVRGRLSEGEVPSDIVDAVADLTGALNKSSLPRGVGVFRGTRLASIERQLGSKLVEGSEFSDQGFGSWSASREVAEAFTEGFREAAIFQVRLPSGTRALVMGNREEFYEFEVLLQRGAKFRVAKIEREVEWRLSQRPLDVYTLELIP